MGQDNGDRHGHLVLSRRNGGSWLAPATAIIFTRWDLNPRPSACGAGVITLHPGPLNGVIRHSFRASSILASLWRLTLPLLHSRSPVQHWTCLIHMMPQQAKNASALAVAIWDQGTGWARASMQPGSSFPFSVVGREYRKNERDREKEGERAG